MLAVNGGIHLETITFTATGDSFITRRLPGQGPEFREIKELIERADAKFTNFEMTVQEGDEGIPGAVSGGTWARAKPEVLEDLKNFGFNLVAWGNNHTLDYSISGMKATERFLDHFGFVHGGAGDNLAKASEPRYLETLGGRIAMIAAVSTFHESWAAGDQRKDINGRPGVNPLRYQTVHRVSAEQLRKLNEVASVTGINAARNLSIKEGFKTARTDGLLQFGDHLFGEGKPGKETTPDKRDLARIIRSIHEAKRQADYVLISIHAHEMKGEEKSLAAGFLETFARRCIDEGADAVIGHGPHILRGIEIYKNRPIFYSLGNFIFQNETVTHLPSDFYETFGLGQTDSVADALDARSRNNTIGFGVKQEIWESVLPFWKMEAGELTELTLYPIELGYGQPRYRRGWPQLSKDSSILQRIAALSEKYGTQLVIEEGVAHVMLKSNVAV